MEEAIKMEKIKTKKYLKVCVVKIFVFTLRANTN